MSLKQNAPAAALPPPVPASYSIRIHIRSKILIWLPCVLLWPLLIQFLLENLIKNTPLAALPPPVAASYLAIIQI